MSIVECIVFIAITLVVLLALIILLMWINGKQRMLRDREEMQRLRELLGSHIPPKLKALDDWKVEVHTAIRLAEPARPKRRGEARDEYDRKLMNQLLHCDKYEQMFTLTDTRLNGFADYMRKNFQLSDRELMFVCLSVLDLSDEQVALLMEYSVASIPTTRKRIGKKLGVENSAG